jgi:predicted phage terminase large subunit-like protein
MTQPSELFTALLRRDYPTFARRAFRLVSAGRKLSGGPYVEVLFQAAIDVYTSAQRRMVVNLPPRHGKTLAFSVPLIAWWIAHRPKDSIMALSFREERAHQIVDRVRQLFREDWMKRAFPKVKITKGHDRLGDFSTTEGGRVFGLHIGRGITGEGAELILMDDPCDISDATHPGALAAINEIFDAVIRTRLNDPSRGCVVIVGHRVHARDPSGHVRHEPGWARVVLPFIATEDAQYRTPNGYWLRRRGELLRPDAFDGDEVGEIERRRNFAAVYQQEPEGEATWVPILPDHFPLFTSVPADADGLVLSIDTAHTAGAGRSYTVIQVWRSAHGQHFLLHQVRAQLSHTEVEREVSRVITQHRPSVVLVEAAALGAALIEHLALRALRERFELVPVHTGNRTKFLRFTDVVATILAGAVHLPKHALWVEAFLRELMEFPNGDSDDQVDALVQYLMWRIANPNVPPRPARSAGSLPSGHAGASRNGRGGLLGRRYVWPRKK